MTTKKTNVSARYRNFATVVYPDSAPAEWQEALSEAHIPAFISPLHDRDVNPNGEAKKAHYHVMVMFEGKKSIEQVREIFDTIGGVGVEVINTLRGYARYLCHLDNPEKARYEPERVTSLCGADYASCIGLPTDKYKCISEIIEFCKDNEIFSFCDLMDYCRAERFDWFRVLCDSGAYVVKEYLKSRKWKISRT